MKTFIIAEAGVNHNGDLEIAKKLIDVAADAGADAVKFQTFRAELLVTDTAPQVDYQTRNIGKAESQFDMLKRLELPRPWHPILQEYAKERGIMFLSTPFHEDDADFLESINIPMFKIPSGEITNIPYLRHIAAKKKKMIVSTGMATLTEVKEAVKAIRGQGNDQIVVLHSTSNYPPSLGSLNLNAITTLERELREWSIPIGYSDNGSPGYLADV
ncbi:MAG: N-acetylneuraminate synthase family protein, partial [Candidatus Yonathbacteria bacterium]|nr:N-acetylneuraminate synthase family protein [Candidatus Yonathbacteria bacterium]